MADRNRSVPELGLFYGDQGGPGTSLPASDAHKLCPFLAGDTTFCSLDGALCPFIGFNYRRCKKYTNNIAKGAMQVNLPVIGSNKGPRVSHPPLHAGSARHEALVEAAKKGGSKKKKKATAKDIDRAIDQLERKNPRAAMFAAMAVQLGVERDEGADPTTLQADLEGAMRELVNTGTVVLPVFKTVPGKSPADRKVRDPHANKKIQAQKVQLANQKREVRAVLNQVLGAVDDSGRKQNVLWAAESLFDMANDRVEQGTRDVENFYTRQHNVQYHRAGEAEDLFYHQYDDEDKHTSHVGGEDPDTRPHEPRKGPKTDKDAQAESPKEHPKGPKPPSSSAGESEAKGSDWWDASSKAHDEYFKRYKKKKSKKKKKKGKKETTTTTPVAPKRHKSGLPQTSSKVRTAEQFDVWLKELPKQYSQETLEHVFRGQGGKTVKGNMGILSRAAHGLYAKNAVKDIADMRKVLLDKLDRFDDIEHKKKVFDQEWEENKRRARVLDPDLDKKLKAWREDPEKLGKIAKMQNKAIRNLYTLEYQKQKIGNVEVARIIKKATMPVLDRGDYEVMRMSEQLGLAAIQKRHQYGLKYGKFNTWVLFVKQLLAPFVLLISGNAGYIQPVMRAFPQGWLDSLFFSYLDPGLPKYAAAKHSPTTLSRDDKTMASLRMSTGRREKLMKGWSKDYTMPPDRAIMHSRWYPTTKKSWGKTRKKELTKRWQTQKTQAPGAADTWRRGFLRR